VSIFLVLRMILLHSIQKVKYLALGLHNLSDLPILLVLLASLTHSDNLLHLTLNCINNMKIHLISHPRGTVKIVNHFVGCFTRYVVICECV
jgi:hypothetical protein